MADENFDWYCKWLRDATRVIKIRQPGKGRGDSLLTKEMRRGMEMAEEKMKKTGQGKVSDTG